MIYLDMSNKAAYKRIQQAIIASKPKMIKGKATYLDVTYTSLDDAWDWFEADLELMQELEAAE
jgi:hypothetical protein